MNIHGGSPNRTYVATSPVMLLKNTNLLGRQLKFGKFIPEPFTVSLFHSIG